MWYIKRILRYLHLYTDNRDTVTLNQGRPECSLGIAAVILGELG